MTTYPVAYLEPMVNMCPQSTDYLQPFGIRIVYKNGQTKTYCGRPDYVLCNILTKHQRRYAERLIATIAKTKEA